MAKWAKKKAGRLVKNLYLPPMRRTGESLATSDNDEKAKILTEKIFPQPASVDLNNIIGKILATRLKVDNDITTEKMAKTISHFLNNTALRLNKIPNEALKTYGPLITLWLVDIAKTYFIIGYYLRFKKAIIIIVLRKEGKANYLFLKNYRLIALKTPLIKFLKK